AGSGSTIAGAAGIGFDLNLGTGDVTYDGTISAGGASRPVEVTNHTGGTVDFKGTVTGTGQGDNLPSNANATLRCDGGLILSTAAHNALSATGGGAVAVPDPNPVGTPPDNTLTTTSGTALTVTSTVIGADGLTFRSISSNGATNGILLNSTGASGS